MQNILIVNSL